MNFLLPSSSYDHPPHNTSHHHLHFQTSCNHNNNNNYDNKSKFGEDLSNISNYSSSWTSDEADHHHDDDETQGMKKRSIIIMGSSTSSDHQHHHQIMRKQRRMISNRESARRSRARKQKQLDELWSQVVWLRNENNLLLDKLSQASETHALALRENDELKQETSQLRQMLCDMRLNSPSPFSSSNPLF